MKKYLKKNYKSVIFYALIYALIMIFFTVPLPYTVHLPGGVQSAEVFLEIENAYESKGSFNSSYVSVIDKPSSFQYLVSKFNDKADIYKLSKEQSKVPISEIRLKDSLYKESSIYHSLIAAYTAANKEIKYSENGVVIIDRIIGTPAYELLKVGDIITKVNGVSVNNFIDVSKELDKIACDESFTLTIIRDNETKRINIKKEQINEDTCLVGLYQDYTYTNYLFDFTGSNPKISNIDKSGYGPSAGLIQTLSIYNMLTPIDITFGLKIAGTGTIDATGKVGPIGGIEQKVFGACKANVDIFFTPTVHYEDAIAARDLMKSDMIVYKVDTLDDAINYLLDNYGQNK